MQDFEGWRADNDVSLVKDVEGLTRTFVLSRAGWRADNERRVRLDVRTAPPH